MDRGELIHGDCIEAMAARRSESVDLVLTDPPYNSGLTAKSGTRLNNLFDDRRSPSAYAALARGSCREMYRLLRADRGAYVFISWKSLGVWLEALTLAGFTPKNAIVWDKVIHGLNHQNYSYTYELLIFAVKGRFHPANRGSGPYRTDVWHLTRATRQVRQADFHHDTVKPLPLLSIPILHGSDPGDIVLDPFMGSGSTCVSARALGRRFVGIEHDLRYYRLAERRLAEAP